MFDEQFVDNQVLKSYMHAMCPDRRIRKLVHLNVRQPTPSVEALGYTEGSLRLFNLTVKGWRTSEGRFIPLKNCPGFQRLHNLGALGPDWLAAAKSDPEVMREAQLLWAKQHDPEPVCMEPLVFNEWVTDTPEARNTHSEMHGTLEIDTGVFVHVFYTNRKYNAVRPVSTCPNAPLWDSTAGYAQIVRPS